MKIERQGNDSWRTIIRSIEILTPVYDFGSDIVGLFSPKLLRYIVSRLYVPSKIALEVGIGTGLLSKKILDRSNAYLVGVDVSRVLAYISKSRLRSWGERVDIIISQAEKLPFRNKVMESVYMTFTYRDVINHLNTALEISRILNLNGVWIIADVGKPTNKVSRLLLSFILKYIARILGRLIYPSLRVNPWKALYLTYKRIYPNDVLRKLLTEIFSNVRIISLLGGMLYIAICRK